MVPPPSQYTVGICDPITHRLLYDISSRLVTFLKATFAPVQVYDILGLTVGFKFTNFSFQIFLVLLLKCLPISCLTLFGLSTLLWFWSNNHYILASFLWCKSRKHSSSNPGLCRSISYRPRLSLAGVIIFCVMFSQALFLSLLSLSSPKLQKRFEILIWYCFLTSSSLCFLRLNLSTSNFFGPCLLSTNPSLIFSTTTQWLVTQSTILKDRTSSILECHLLSINMWSVLLWVFPSGEVQVYLRTFRCGNIIFLTTKFYDVTKFTIPTQLLLLS